MFYLYIVYYYYVLGGSFSGEAGAWDTSILLFLKCPLEPYKKVNNNNNQQYWISTRIFYDVIGAVQKLSLPLNNLIQETDFFQK